MPTFQDWDIPDVSSALQMAESGSMQMIGRLSDALIGDGAIVGQLTTRYDGMLQLPRVIEGPSEVYAAELRKDFDTLCSPSELGLLARDGGVLNIIFGEILEDEDGDLRLVRRNPEFLTYRHSENQWYVRTAIGGIEPVNPGDGRWLLAFPHGSDYPWRYGLWQALSFAYINRRQAFLHLNAWNNSLAFPIKKLTTPNGGNEEEAQETFDAINHFGPFPAIRLNEGWAFDLVQPGSATPASLKDAIEASEREVVLTVSGQSGTTDPGPGFGNVGFFAKIKSDLVQVDTKTFAHALNEQVIPVWAQRKHSFDGWFQRPSVRWDSTPPKDLAAEANVANVAATAAKAWDEALLAAGANKRVDVAAFAKHHGIPMLEVLAHSEAGAKAPTIALAPTDLANIILVNEGRASAGVGLLMLENGSLDPDGRLTVGQYVAKITAAASNPPAAPAAESAPPVAPTTSGDATDGDGDGGTEEEASALAEKMTEHGVERCGHGSVNRCRLCGVERLRDFTPGENGDHKWHVAWRPISRPAPPNPKADLVARTAV